MLVKKKLLKLMLNKQENTVLLFSLFFFPEYGKSVFPSKCLDVLHFSTGAGSLINMKSNLQIQASKEDYSKVLLTSIISAELG